MTYDARAMRAYRATRKRLGRPVPKTAKVKPIVALDGEGVSDADGSHRYVMLTYSDASGEVSDTLEAAPGERLTSRECLHFLLDMRARCPNTLFVGFSLGYDWAKILEDLDNESIYKLYRPELRKWRVLNRVRWSVRYGHYRINNDGPQCTMLSHTSKPKQWLRVWDMWKYCQSSFVKAIVAWGVGTSKEVDLVKEMKARRGVFSDGERAEMRAYNALECRLLAELMAKIIEAHGELRSTSLPDGLRLRRYDGPGASVNALFKAWGLRPMFETLKKQHRTPELSSAIASAFFGGRFENRVFGYVDNGKPWDIHSAYPAQICHLPCIEHGAWTRTTSEHMAKGGGALGLIRYELNEHAETPDSGWGPFPFREKDGSICFPIVSGGGWVWGVEFFAARRTGLWPGIRLKEAWIWQSTCKCDPPFASIVDIYLRRFEVGKDTGQGITIKLIINSCYGKLAQSVGIAPFQSWIYAGLITAGTRAAILDFLGVHRDPCNLLAIATDGVLTRELVTPPGAPRTGAEHIEKPLGGWGSEPFGPLWLVRPGIALGTKIRARGIGRDELAANAERVKLAAATDSHVRLSSIARFVGARTGVRFVASSGAYVRSDTFGKWVLRPQVLSFDPLPKRATRLPDGTLTLRKVDGVSTPYDGASRGDEAKELQAQTLEESEQPDQLEEFDETE